MSLRRFWYLRGDNFDTSSSFCLDMYIQEVLSYGYSEDIRKMFKIIDKDKIKLSFSRIKYFLPLEVKKFWEDEFTRT